MLLALLGCAEPGEVRGSVEDALGGEIPDGLVLVAHSAGAPGACARIEAPVSESGDFALGGLCPGHRYRIEPTDPNWWAGEAEPVAGGEAVTGHRLRLWHAPAEDGVFVLRGGTLSRVVSQSALDTVTELATGRELRVPAEIPAEPPTPAGGWLVLAGSAAVALSAFPLSPTEPLVAGPATAPRQLGAWFALGAPRDVPGADVRGPAPPSAEATLSDGSPDRVVRFVRPDALPAGDWALSTPDATRAILVRFGGSP